MISPKCFAKIPLGRIIPDFSFESSESYRVFNYLNDSNLFFRAAGINSEIFAEYSSSPSSPLHLLGCCGVDSDELIPPPLLPRVLRPLVCAAGIGLPFFLE